MNKERKAAKRAYKKKRFLVVFACFIVLMSTIKHAWSFYEAKNMEYLLLKEPREVYIGDPKYEAVMEGVEDAQHTDAVLAGSQEDEAYDTLLNQQYEEESEMSMEADSGTIALLAYKMGNVKMNYDECFPDTNETQLMAATENGIEPVGSRETVRVLAGKQQLSNISNSPLYVVDNLTHSMPYLVPKAQHLLNTIALNFMDSLTHKGLQPHKIVVTSVLRTREDVSKLQRQNRNATTNSCHCYGTTIDISYTQFAPIKGKPLKSKEEYTRGDPNMKRILAEVLADLRMNNKCFVKYEKRQTCFHLTTR